MKLYISHAGSFDYEAELYGPLLSSRLANLHDIFLPHQEAAIGIDTAQIIKNSDAVIAEASYPSTGQGIELSRAQQAGVPILCLYKRGTRPSGSLKFVGATVSEYEEFEDFIAQVEAFVSSLA